MAKLKILKDGNHTTYILTRDGENIPLVSVEKDIKVEKTRIESEEIAYALIAALRHAVMMRMKQEDVYYRRCPIEKFYWQFVKEGEFIEVKEVLRQDE